MSDRATRSEVAAPISGTVNKLFASTVGGTVKSGEPLAQIVPTDASIEVEARLSPADRAEVWPGLAGGRQDQRLRLFDLWRAEGQGHRDLLRRAAGRARRALFPHPARGRRRPISARTGRSCRAWSPMSTSCPAARASWSRWCGRPASCATTPCGSERRGAHLRRPQPRAPGTSTAIPIGYILPPRQAMRFTAHVAQADHPASPGGALARAPRPISCTISPIS